METKANTPSDLGIMEFRNMLVCNSFSFNWKAELLPPVLIKQLILATLFK